MTPRAGYYWKIGIIVAGIAIAGLLWMSWRNGTLPFESVETSATQGDQALQPTREEALDSLSAGMTDTSTTTPNVPPESSIALPPAPKAAAPSSSSSETESILDSLTP